MRPRTFLCCLKFRQSPCFLPGLMLVAGSLWICGCDQVPPRPPLGKQAKDSMKELESLPTKNIPPPVTAARDNRVATTLSEISPPASHAESRLETWERYELRGKRIGYRHIVAEPVDEDVARLVQVSIEEKVNIRRGEQIVEQVFRLTSLEPRKGGLLSFEATGNDGQKTTTTTGRLSLDRLTVTVTPDGQPPQSRQLPWQPRYGSFLAVQQSLRAKPLEAKETRRLQALAPVFFQIVDIELKTIGHANVPVDGGDVQRLLEVEEKTSLNGTTLMKSIHWMDNQGELLKSYIPALDLLSFRTDEAGATKVLEESPPDLMSVTRIALNKRSAPEAETVTYRLKHADAEFSIAANPRQTVEEASEESLRVTVTSQPEPSEDDHPPQPSDSEASPLVEIDDPEIQKLAALAETSEDDVFALATELRDIVSKHIETKDFSQTFASAAQTASSKTGDCTEHAVLLTALCRARKIPARLVAGLVQINDAEGPAMNYHAWTLVWDGEKWQPLDAMFGDRPIGTDRIELLTTDLADGNAYAALTPVMQVIGQLKIEIE